MMSGAAVVYKTKFQQTVAMLSTEAEFVAAADAGEYALYLRSLLKDLGEDQQSAVVLYKDNVGAYLMANTGQPTSCTQHIDRAFCLTRLGQERHDNTATYRNKHQQRRQSHKIDPENYISLTQ